MTGPNTQPAARAVAPPELLAQFSAPRALSILARQNRWPFKGMRVVRDRVDGLVLDGGIVEETDFELDEVTGARWTDTVFRGCRFEIGRMRALSTVRVKFDNCQFDGGDLSDGIMRSTELVSCTLSGLRMTDVVIDGVRLQDTLLDSIMLERVSASGVELTNAGVTAFAGFDSLIEKLKVIGGYVTRARVGGGEWSDVEMVGTAISGVEATQTTLADLRLTGTEIINCSQSEGALNGLTIESPKRVFSTTFSGVAMRDVRISQAPDVSFFAVLRSVLRGFTVSDSTIRAMEFRSTLLDSPVQLNRTIVSGADFRGSDVREFRMTEGTLDGSVRLDNARVAGWTMTGTATGTQLGVTGTPERIVDSDVRLSQGQNGTA